MLNSVQHIARESDDTERALIISNLLVRQRASKQMNVHLERKERIREAVSRHSLVKQTATVMEEHSYSFLSTQKTFQVQLYEMLAIHLSPALPFN